MKCFKTYICLLLFVISFYGCKKRNDVGATTNTPTQPVTSFLLDDVLNRIDKYLYPYWYNHPGHFTDGQGWVYYYVSDRRGEILIEIESIGLVITDDQKFRTENLNELINQVRVAGFGSWNSAIYYTMNVAIDNGTTSGPYKVFTFKKDDPAFHA